jgi:translation initiation factor IF-2
MAMAKSSVFDRADFLRSRGKTPEAAAAKQAVARTAARRRAAVAESSETASPTTTTGTIRRRRRAVPPPESVEAKTTTSSTIVRGRTTAQTAPVSAPTPPAPPRPEPVIKLPPTEAKVDAEVPAVEATPSEPVGAKAPLEPTPEVAKRAEALPPVQVPLPPATDADSPAADDGPRASLDDLLGAAPQGRRHAVLSDVEIAADQARLRGDEPPAAPAEAAPAEPAPAEAAPAEAAPAEAAPEGAPVAEGEAAAAAEKQAGGDSLTLEALLRQQGIVQHKPKKGRRIIEDDLTQQTQQRAQPAPRPAGVSIFEEKKPRGPVRFLDPASLLRERQGRLKQQAAQQQKRKGRKSVVQRRDALYGTHGTRRRTRRSTKGGMPIVTTTPAAHKRVVKVDGTIRVSALAHQLGEKSGHVIKILVGLGQMVTLNEMVDMEAAQCVAEEFGYTVEDASFKEEEFIEEVGETEEDSEAEPRPPVVTIMGHVDHGKTTLLDAIRNARVAAGEAGGITQHISAFHVDVRNEKITFVDTPGHAAFTAMRARGAQVTDIVVLVIAASEGVMPQTEEVIAHAKAAGVPVIVAINKIDLPESNPERTRQQLSEHNLIPEAWGGDTQMIEVSAKEGTGLDDLLDAILLQAELMELKANPNRPAVARVVEAQLEKGRGPVATVLIQAGTLRPGQVVVAGIEYGRVRAMLNDKGKRVKEAGPSVPVSILGLSGLPNAGDELAVVENDRAAKALVEHRQGLIREKREATGGRISLEDAFRRLEEGEVKQLNLIIKADVRGSVEALKHALAEITVDDTSINILHASVGGVTEGDVTLASASSAVIIGFGVRPDAKARRLGDREGVDIRTYRVIYQAVDEIKQALVGLLDPIFKETVVGHAEVREIFKIPKLGMIAGCSVQDGRIGRNHSARLLRNSIVIWEGKLGSLRRFKDDVKEVLQGYECGIGLANYDDLKVDDVVETFIVEEVAREL